MQGAEISTPPYMTKIPCHFERIPMCISGVVKQLPLFYGTHLEQRLLKNSQEKQKDPSIRSKNPIANRSILRRCPENT